MESDYATNYAGAGTLPCSSLGGADCDSKPLEGLASIAEEAERTATLISSFIIRFRHGHVPTSDKKMGLAPVPSGHAGQLSRVRDAVAELNKLARDLNTLG